ncbi:MAG: UDP-N-acetylglucosamine 2-epimerase (non-hydrolyzing) [Stellaceae bacterium]
MPAKLTGCYNRGVSSPLELAAGGRDMRDVKILQDEELAPEVGITVGTRPGIIMFAPIIHEFRKRGLPHFVIHTGQHYSPNLDAQLFDDLELPAPDYRLAGVAEKRTHGGQTAVMLEGIEQILMQRRPCLFLIGGDANTNLAGALAARKLRINVGHVEAGERSHDWRMPEEHNRVVIDHISDHLFVTSDHSIDNLRQEAVRGQIHLVGNPIVDASLQHLDLAMRKSDALQRFGLEARKYALLTTHREENVDVAQNLRQELEGVSAAARALSLPVLFLAHPRTLKRLEEFDLAQWAAALPGVTIAEGVGYLDFLALLANARLVFTDSGGVQQEACIHHVPCVTLRDNTEWVDTLKAGANRLAGCEPRRIVAAAQEAVAAERDWPVPFGDGSTARQIAAIAGEIIAAYREPNPRFPPREAATISPGAPIGTRAG